MSIAKRMNEKRIKEPPSWKDKMVNRTPKPSPCFWKGPEVDGVTQGLLAGFLTCRERFRIKVIEGLAPAPSFNHRLGFGSMWHICEEYHAQRQDCRPALEAYCKQLQREHPTEQAQILKWYQVCLLQFPEYVKYWATHSDVRQRTPLVQEVSFDVPYTLPSGRVVRLRGKWDSIDIIGKGKDAAIYLQENKTTGDLDEYSIARKLTFELQTGLYLTALSEEIRQSRASDEWLEELVPLHAKPKLGIGGVRYNVVVRPLSGGKHSIRQKKGQTEAEFYKELQGRIAGDPEFFFHRWKVEISPSELQRFRHRGLDKYLEQLYDWWEEVPHLDDPFESRHHWQHPYGLYNPMDNGKTTDLDNYIMTGNRVGLVPISTLYPELEE